jgi:hypothetical protein
MLELRCSILPMATCEPRDLPFPLGGVRVTNQKAVVPPAPLHAKNPKPGFGPGAALQGLIKTVPASVMTISQNPGPNTTEGKVCPSRKSYFKQGSEGAALATVTQS